MPFSDYNAFSFSLNEGGSVILFTLHSHCKKLKTVLAAEVEKKCDITSDWKKRTLRLN